MEDQERLFPNPPKGTNQNQWGRETSLPPAHRAAGWDTERRAARRPREGQRMKVYEAFKKGPRSGMTDYEISEALGVLRGTVAKRRQELCHLGFVEATEWRRRTDSGSSAIVWKLVEL